MIYILLFSILSIQLSMAFCPTSSTTFLPQKKIIKAVKEDESENTRTPPTAVEKKDDDSIDALEQKLAQVEKQISGFAPPDQQQLPKKKDDHHGISPDVFDKAFEEAFADLNQTLPGDLFQMMNMKEIFEEDSFRKEIEAKFANLTKREMELDSTIKQLEQDEAEYKRERVKEFNERMKQMSDALKDDISRMEVAQDSMKHWKGMMEKETGEVKKARDALDTAMKKMEQDPMTKLAKGGLPKQAALAGGILFIYRSVWEFAAVILGPGGDSHIAPALIQALIAAACVIYFRFL